MSGEDSRDETLTAKTEAFLNEFFYKGQELVKELIVENERLRAALGPAGQGTPRTVAPAGEAAAQAIERLMNRIDQLEAECNEIRKIAGFMERQSGDYRERLRDLEQEHYHLASMYVAGSQFNSAATLDEVLRTVAEILLNFVGVGRFTVYCMDEERQVLFPLMREGGNLSDCDETAVDAGPIAEVVKSGLPWRGGAPMGEAPGALMHLPMVSGTRLVGVTRIESFLPQKSAFGDSDVGLLELISEHSGVGIETAWIRAHAREMPLGRRAVEHLVGA